jgi:hypothetical protein
VLTEAERIHHGLHKTDVSPCVTSLRELPDSVKNLDRDSFRQHYVEAGKRCWLIRSASSSVSTRLRSYLQNVPKVARENYTCTNQDPWYAYESVPAPKLLVSSAFTGRTPKTVTNSIGAKAVGVMYGVHSRGKLDSECLRKHLSKQDLKSRIVAHAKTLRKIEVRQLNAILTEWANDANGG